jgi:hypothetical protein
MTAIAVEACQPIFYKRNAIISVPIPTNVRTAKARFTLNGCNGDVTLKIDSTNNLIF